MSDTVTNTAPVVDTKTSESVSTTGQDAVVNSEAAPIESLVTDPMIKEWVAHKGLKTINDAFKSHMHLESLIGKRVTEMTPEELVKVNAKFGAPKSANDYKLPDFDKLDPEFVNSFRETAHKAGVSQYSAENLFKMFVDRSAKESVTQQHQAELVEDTNRRKLEEKFGQMTNEAMRLASQEIMEKGGQPMVDKLTNPKTLDVDLIEMFYKSAKEKLGHTLVAPQENQRFVGMTPAEAKEEIALLMNTPEYKEAMRRNNRRVLDPIDNRLRGLFRIAKMQ